MILFCFYYSKNTLGTPITYVYLCGGLFLFFLYITYLYIIFVFVFIRYCIYWSLILFNYLNFVYFFWWCWGLNSGPHTWYTSALSRNPHFQLFQKTVLVTFWIGWSWVFAHAGLDDNPPIYPSYLHLAGGCHHVQLHWLRLGTINFLLGLALNYDVPNLYFLSSWDYRHDPLHLAYF
jgi:hypothetical protein